MNSSLRHSRIRTYSKLWACVLALALPASCNPTPGSTETTATPIAVAPSPTAPPPTARPPTPTAPPPTALPPTPTAPEVPTESANAQPRAGAAYLVYQRPDGSLWRSDGNSEALAWTPQGDALVYSVGGEQPGLRLWAIGAEGDLKPLATTPSRQLRWSLDGQRLATDSAIYMNM